MPPLTKDLLVQALDVYFQTAFGSVPVPAKSQPFARADQCATIEEILSLKGVEKGAPEPGRGERFLLRLGNPWYPHMKVIVSTNADGSEVIFAVETHDLFEVPANSPEAGAIRELQERNRTLARTVEESWERANVPTQAGVMREYLQSVRGTK